MNATQFESRIAALENETTEEHDNRLAANDEKAEKAAEQAASAAAQQSGDLSKLSPEEQAVFKTLAAKAKSG